MLTTYFLLLFVVKFVIFIYFFNEKKKPFILKQGKRFENFVVKIRSTKKCTVV